MLNQLPRVKALKIELQELTTLGIPELWKADGSPVPEAKLLKGIQKNIKKIDDVDALLASFEEANLLKFFDSWANGGVSLQQFLQKNNCTSYEVLNTIALALSRLKDIFGMHANWGKVQ